VAALGRMAVRPRLRPRAGRRRLARGM